jgi:hypothetical protein
VVQRQAQTGGLLSRSSKEISPRLTPAAIWLSYLARPSAGAGIGGLPIREMAEKPAF